jgi:hypothetical protein
MWGTGTTGVQWISAFQSSNSVPADHQQIPVPPMSKINLSQTQVRMPDSIKWTGQEGFPKNSLENAVLAGSLNGEGIYFTLVKWYPG